MVADQVPRTIREKLKKIVVCCGGSIGVIDIPRLILTLRRAYDSDVHVAMTASAQRFITPYSLEVCSGNAVGTDLFAGHPGSVPHLQMIKGAGVCIVAPATANLIGKFASAICDDFVTTIVASAQCPIIVVPSMHESMWAGNILRAKVSELKRAKFHFVEPGIGLEISNLSKSMSSMPAVDDIIAAVLTKID